MNGYTTSKEILELPRINKLSAATKKKYQAIREGKTMTEANLQSLANSICDDLKVPRCRVSYKGKQPSRSSEGRLKQKTYGSYRFGFYLVTLYKYTAKTGQVVANKTMLNTLVHELCHHFDYTLLDLTSSPHTSGFYTRISTLEKALQS